MHANDSFPKRALKKADYGRKRQSDPFEELPIDPRRIRTTLTESQIERHQKSNRVATDPLADSSKRTRRGRRGPSAAMHRGGRPDAPSSMLFHGGISDVAHVIWGAVIERFARECRVFHHRLAYGHGTKPGRPTHCRSTSRPTSRRRDPLGWTRLRSPAFRRVAGQRLGSRSDQPPVVDRVVSIDSRGLKPDPANGQLTAPLAESIGFDETAVHADTWSRKIMAATLGVSRPRHGRSFGRLIDAVRKRSNGKVRARRSGVSGPRKFRTKCTGWTSPTDSLAWRP